MKRNCTNIARRTEKWFCEKKEEEEEESLKENSKQLISTKDGSRILAHFQSSALKVYNQYLPVKDPWKPD